MTLGKLPERCISLTGLPSLRWQASDLLDSSETATTDDPSTLPQPPADDPLVRTNALYFEGQPLTEVRSEASAEQFVVTG